MTMNLSPQDVVVVLKSLLDGTARAAQENTDDHAKEIELKFLAASSKSRPMPNSANRWP